MRPNLNCEICGEIGVFYKRPMASGFHIGEMCSSCDATIGQWISAKLFTSEEIKSFKELECKSLGICSACRKYAPLENHHPNQQSLKIKHAIANIIIPLCKECHDTTHRLIEQKLKIKDAT